MIAEDALHVLAVGAGLAAVARREGRVLARQRRLRQHFAGVQGRQRHLRRWNQVQRAALVGFDGLEELLLELRQLSGAQHRLGVHQVREPELGVAVLARLEVEHELRDRALEPRERPPHHGESRLGEPRGAIHVEQAEVAADFLVGFRLEVEPARCAPAPDLDVLLVALAGRHRWVREIRDLDEQRLDGLVDGLHLGVERLDAIAHLAHTRLLGAGILAGLARAPDGLGGRVALGLEVVRLLDEATPLDVLGEDLRDELGAALLGERPLHLVGPLPDQPQVEHGPTVFRRGRRSRPRRERSSRPCRRRRGR